MAATRRDVLLGASLMGALQTGNVTRYVRYKRGETTSYGVLEGDVIRPIQGYLFGEHRATSEKIKLAGVKLLYPVQPPKVLAVGRNYRSHLGSTPPPPRPEIFYKPITCLQHPGDAIVIPKDARNVHYEGELVVVMGKRAQNISIEEAPAAIFGVTCGNDVSERDWQGGAGKDLQWWRAKGADTFGPLGPVIARGLNYSNLQLTTRLNGEVKQKQSTSDLLFDCATVVSFISRYVTLEAGDVIYTGTPGSTSPMKAGDTVEVEIEGIGILKNPLV